MTVVQDCGLCVLNNDFKTFEQMNFKTYKMWSSIEETKKHVYCTVSAQKQTVWVSMWWEVLVWKLAPLFQRETLPLLTFLYERSFSGIFHVFSRALSKLWNILNVNHNNRLVSWFFAFWGVMYNFATWD